MRAGELAANTVFWLGAPASGWWMVTRLEWSLWAAVPAAIVAAAVAALVTSFVVGALLD